MGFREFSGELDAPTSFREFDGELDQGNTSEGGLMSQESKPYAPSVDTEKTSKFKEAAPIAASLISGTTKLGQTILDTPKFAADVVNEIAVNPFLHLFGKDLGPAKRMEFAQDLEAVSKELTTDLRNKPVEDIGLSTPEARAETANWIAQQAAAQSPQMVGGGVASFVPKLRNAYLGFMAATSGADSNVENQRAGVDDQRRVIGAATNGAWEAVGEALPFEVFDKIGGLIKRLPDSEKAAFISDITKKTLAATAAMTAQHATEGVGEMVTQAGQNWTQRDIIGDKNVEIGDGVLTAGAIGAIMATPTSVAHGVQAYRDDHRSVPDMLAQPKTQPADILSAETTDEAIQKFAESVATDDAESQFVNDNIPAEELLTGLDDPVMAQAADAPPFPTTSAEQPAPPFNQETANATSQPQPDLRGAISSELDIRPTAVTGGGIIAEPVRPAAVDDQLATAQAQRDGDAAGADASLSGGGDTAVDGRRGAARETEARRSNVDLRQQYDAMSPEDRAAALDDLHRKAYVSDLTGLQNKRAFEEHVTANPQAKVLYGDVDGLKALNTRYGHNGADQILKAVGEVKAAVASELGVNAFHRSGDEFLAVHPDPAILDSYGAEVQKRLDSATVEVTLPDGTVEKHVGIGLSYGVGENADTAEARAETQKAARKSGAIPVQAAGGNQDQPGIPAETSRADLIRTVTTPVSQRVVTPQNPPVISAKPAETAQSAQLTAESKPVFGTNSAGKITLRGVPMEKIQSVRDKLKIKGVIIGKDNAVFPEGTNLQALQVEFGVVAEKPQPKAKPEPLTAEEKARRAPIMKNAKALGIKTVARPFSDIEKDVLAAIEEEHTTAVDQLSDAEYQQLDDAATELMDKIAGADENAQADLQATIDQLRQQYSGREYYEALTAHLEGIQNETKPEETGRAESGAGDNQEAWRDESNPAASAAEQVAESSTAQDGNVKQEEAKRKAGSKKLEVLRAQAAGKISGDQGAALKELADAGEHAAVDEVLNQNAELRRAATNSGNGHSVLFQEALKASAGGPKAFSKFFNSDAFLSELNYFLDIPFDSGVLGNTSQTIDGNSTPGKGSVNSVFVHAKALRDILQSETITNQGLGGADAETQRLVLSHVLALSKNTQVLDSVIQLVPVDVVNYLGRKQLSPDSLFNNPSVLKRAIAGDLRLAVPAMNVPDALVRAIALSGAEVSSGRVGADLERPSKDGSSASGALNTDFRHRGDNTRSGGLEHESKETDKGTALFEPQEGYGDQTDTPAFRNWFGDSKVVDAEGKPLVFGGFFLKNNIKPIIPAKYTDALIAGLSLREDHRASGKYKDMTVHEMRRESSEFGDLDKLGQIMFELGWRGYQLSELTPTVASRVGDIPSSGLSRDAASGVVEYGVSVIEQLTIDNQSQRTFYDDLLSSRGDRQYIAGFKNPFYDGADGEPLLLFPIKINGGIASIKSAIGNNGQFDPNSPSIIAEPPRAAYNENQQDLFADPYDTLETRPGTTEAQLDAGRAALTAVEKRIFSPSMRGRASVLGSAISKDFRDNGYISLVGQKVTSSGDLALVAQVLRDPRFETFRAFYIKDGKVIGERAYTSRMAGQVSLTPEIADHIGTDMQRTGATGYWLMHNHPSGRATASQSDLRLTEMIAGNAPGMLGHVIIDHNEYNSIEVFSKGISGLDAVEEVIKTDFGAAESMPEVAHTLLGFSLNSPREAAAIAKHLQREGVYSAIIGRNAKGEVSMVLDVPGIEANGKIAQMRAAAMVRRAARETGSVDVFAVVPGDLNKYQHLMARNGLFRDVIVAETGVSAAERGIGFGSSIDPTKAQARGMLAYVAEPVTEYNPKSQTPLDLQGGENGNQASWDSPEPSKMDDIIYTLQDKHIDMKRVVAAIKDAGGKLIEKFNPYLAEELFHGRAAKRTHDFVNTELKPLLADMHMRGLTVEELDRYLHARHAKEANALIAERDPEMQDGGSGMTNAEADKYMEGLDEAKRKRLEAAAAKVDAIITKTRDLYVSYGLISKDQADSWVEMFKHYVPLMREDHDVGMGLGQGFSIKGKEVKHRTGSTAKVVDILANIALQREKAITRGEKNRVAVSLAGLVKLNPNPDFWTFGKPPVERVLNEKTGLVEDRIDPMFKSRENVVVAKIKDTNGEVHERAVIFNEDNERAMRMAESFKNLDHIQLGGVMGVSAIITRYFSSVNTQYNPIFGIVNITRDVQAMALNLSSTPLAKHRADVLKLIPSAVKGIYLDSRAERNGQKANSKWAKLWEELQDEGGMTGYRDLYQNSSERADEIKRELDPTKWHNSKLGKIFTANGALKVPMKIAQERAGWLFDWLSDYNQTLEGATRLAAYKVAIDNGMTKQQAASLAKSITVNFNRRGAVGQQAGAMYAFFNAAMQGSARIAQTMLTYDNGKVGMTKAGKAIVYGGMAIGAMQAVMLAAAGFDDDEPPEFVRERSLVIPIGGKKYITIPMPLGFHVFPNLGRIPTEWALGGFKDTSKRVADMVGIFLEAFNPIGSAGMSLQTLMPTAIDPLVALAENKDWTGKPIYKEDFNSMKPTPGFNRNKDTATAWSKGIAEGLNYLSGGTDYTPGAISPTADQIDYLIGQVTGGVGRELGKIEQTGESAITGEALPPHKVPLLGRFYGNAENQSSQGNAYYSNLKRIFQVEAEIKGRREDNLPTDEYKADNPEWKLITRAKHADKIIHDLKKRKRALVEAGADREKIRTIEDRITSEMRRLNEAVKVMDESA